MAVACASRFSVLSLEDEEPTRAGKSTQNLSQKPRNGTTGNKCNSPNTGVPKALSTTSITNDKTKQKKKKKTGSSEAIDLQNLAFGSTKPKPKGDVKKSMIAPNPKKEEKQWEEWKKKDDELVTEAFEQDLHQAILLSKLDIEEKKENIKEPLHVDKIPGQAPDGKKKKKNNQKKDKPTTMTLEEFQNLLPFQVDGGLNKSTLDATDKPKERQGSVCDEPNFFDQIEEDAEKILRREQRLEEFKKTQVEVKGAQMLALVYQEELQKKDKEIQELTASLEKLKEEMKTVKHRNKRLCNLLAQGEMRDKAEILLQVEQLTQVKDELTEQVTELHASLEQERSKVHSLQSELKKFQSNRRDAKDAK